MTQELRQGDSARFAAAVRRFDEENARDPNRVAAGQVTEARELLYARWLTDWMIRLSPQASEELRLAARCQHLCRWAIPRHSYPMTRAGYLRWREDLKKFHAEKAGEILREVGYPPEIVARVQSLNRKENFPNDAEGRVLEDALCLVFLEHQFGELAAKTSEEKTVNALQKSWRKMTPKAQAMALELSFGPREKELIQKALAAC
jgi:hypothetical protein